MKTSAKRKVAPSVFQSPNVGFVLFQCVYFNVHQELKESQRNQQAALEKLRGIKEDKRRELIRKKEEERKRQEEERRRREEEEAQRCGTELKLINFRIKET